MQGSRFLCVEAVDGEAQSTLMEEVASLQVQGRPYKEVQAHYQSYHAPSPGNIYYRAYRTLDGVLAVGCLSDPLRHKLQAVLGLRDIRFDPDYRVDSPEARSFGEEITAKAGEAVPAEDHRRVVDHPLGGRRAYGACEVYRETSRCLPMTWLWRWNIT